MVKIIDGVLKLPEEPLLIVSLGRDIGQLPDTELLGTALVLLQDPSLQPIPMRLGTLSAGAPQRLRKPKLLVAFSPLANAVDEPVKCFAGLPMA